MTQDKYLVTGAMGCIGAWTLAHLVQAGKKAVSFDVSEGRHRLDMLLTPQEQNEITFLKGDLTDYSQVFSAMEGEKISHIIHLAALQVPFCRANPVLGSQVNVVGTMNILEAARQTGVKHFAYASSIAVYGNATDYDEGLISHTANRTPHTLYGAYKVANEDTARIYFQDYGLSSIGLRPYTVYGVGRDQGLTSDPTKAMLAALKKEPFEINFSGEMQFQLASDVAKQFIAASEQVDFNGADVFNLGGPVTSVSTFVDQIKSLVPGAAITIKEGILPFPTGFDDSTLRDAVPQVYETSLAEGIKATLSHFETLI